MINEWTVRRWLAVAAVGVAVLLTVAGCATTNESFRRAQALAAGEEWEAAIANYRSAVRSEPGNLEFRAALTRVTAQAIGDLLRQAGEIRESQPARSRDLYVRVLLIDPRNESAAAGVRALDTLERQQTLMREAVRAQAAGREREARQKLKQLFDEVPDHVAGRRLLAAMDAAAREKAPSGLDAGFQKRVTLEFRDAPLRSVFDVLSRASGINFIFDRDLRADAKISILVRDIALDEALEQLTTANGLARRVVNGNTLLIYPAQPQKLREYQDQVVHNFFLENADAKQIGSLFRTVLKVRDMFIDEKRNLVVLRDTPEVVAMAVKLVAAHDQPEPEVMLEVEILEIKHTVLDELGIKFPDQLSFGLVSPTTVNAVRAAGGGTIQVTGLDKALILNLKHQIGSTNLLANPRIRVRNREKAKIHIGDRVPVITSTISTVAALTTESVSYLDVGIKLEVEPSIQANDVVIRVSLEVSSVVNTIKTSSGSTAFQLGTRNAATTLTLRDGETQVLAGLIQKSERTNSSRFPGLGDLPVLGRLFSSDAVDGDKTEVLLSITPRIARNIERPSDDLLEFNAGPDGGRPSVPTVSGASGTSAVQGSAPAGAAPTQITLPGTASPLLQSTPPGFVNTPRAPSVAP